MREGPRLDADQALVGRVIASKYKLVELIGNGSMGAVFRAQHLGLGAPVAIKLLRRSSVGARFSGEVLRRFAREARAAAAVRGPHVVQILDHGVDAGTPYMVLELLEGESLEERLVREERLSLRATSKIVTHVARALTKAREAGYIHRDLKPSNVFLVENDGEPIAKVLDFGLAKALATEDGPEESALTEIGKIVGTPQYMSPEQVRGKTIDHRTDLWSLALIAYECVVGCVPFAGGTVQDVMVAICSQDPRPPSAIDPALPAAFDEWFATAVNKEPDNRFQSARELAEALADIAKRVPDRPTPSGPRAARPVTGMDSTVEVSELESGREGPPSGVVPSARPSLPSSELEKLYQSALDLDELTLFWKRSTGQASGAAERLSLVFGDRVLIRDGATQVGVLALEMLQAVRDGHLPPRCMVRKNDSRSGTWRTLGEVCFVGDDGRAIDLAAIAHPRVRSEIEALVPPRPSESATGAQLAAWGSRPDWPRRVAVALAAFAVGVLIYVALLRLR